MSSDPMDPHNRPDRRPPRLPGKEKAEGAAGKAAFVASIYAHFTAFHLPYMKLLQDKGCEVHAYAQPGEGRTRLEQLGVVCHDVPIARSPLSAGNWRALALLTESFREESFRLVHVHTPVASFLGRIAARRTGVPCTIYTAHGFHFYEGAPRLNWLLYYPVERWMARWTDVLITMNGEDWERALRFPVRRKVMYVPGVGIDLGEYGEAQAATAQAEAATVAGTASGDEARTMAGKAAIALAGATRGGAAQASAAPPATLSEPERRELFGLPPRAAEGEPAFVVLCVAELNANKNQRQLVEALGRLGADAGNLHLAMAGAGAAEPALLELAERLGVRDRVHALGYRRDIPRLLRACDAAALVSYREGLPRAVMEAMAAGKPVIGTRIRGIRDLVADAATGLLVPVGDAGATAEALRRLRDEPALAVAMGEAAKARIVSYGLPAVMRDMEAIYTEALAGTAPREAPSAVKTVMGYIGKR